MAETVRLQIGPRASSGTIGGASAKLTVTTSDSVYKVQFADGGTMNINRDTGFALRFPAGRPPMEYRCRPGGPRM